MTTAVATVQEIAVIFRQQLSEEDKLIIEDMAQDCE